MIGYLNADALIDAAFRIAVRDQGVALADIPPAVLAQARSEARAEAFGTGTLIQSVIAPVLLLIFVIVMRTGRNWARIVVSVLSGLGLLAGIFVLFMIASLFVEAGPVWVALLVMIVVQLLLYVVANVFMYRPDANRWFAGTA